ncbi:MAG: UDP-glucose 4-epimerase GalE [Clostridiales bacterium]|nr:UDP-glucose 4-epimerase GalE [Clostridiales bacterium]
MKILLTGGAGYIGSHTAIELIDKGYDIVIADNFSNSKPVVIDRIEEITGKRPAFYNIDVSDGEKLSELFTKEEIGSVIHFAGYKAVGESVRKPIEYYRNNIDSTLTLLEVMKKFGVKKIVFSSSATVYGIPEKVPLKEDMPTKGCTNPYGWTKYMIEQILKDASFADKELSVVLLRYFNPVGAHKSGRIGEDPKGIPNNLMPYISQVAIGKLEKLSVFGNDYNTHDGTGVRDYIHVVDLAKGHVCAIEYAEKHVGAEIINLGTGNGYSVLDMIKAFEKATGKKVPYVFAPRREGDVAECFADASKAKELLSWEAKYSLSDMCEDSWRWQSANPNGYDG